MILICEVQASKSKIKALIFVHIIHHWKETTLSLSLSSLSLSKQSTHQMVLILNSLRCLTERQHQTFSVGRPPQSDGEPVKKKTIIIL